MSVDVEKQGRKFRLGGGKEIQFDGRIYTPANNCMNKDLL